MSAALPILLAHHALVVALPFVVPVLALVIGASVFTVRERRRRAEELRGRDCDEHLYRRRAGLVP